MDSSPFLTSEDSKRVADAMIAAIHGLRATTETRVDAMCSQMETNHWAAEQQRVAQNAPLSTLPRFW